VTFSGLDTSTFADGAVTASAYITANTADISSTISASLSRDIVAPSGSNIKGTNGAVSATLDSGDTLIYSFSEAMDPATIKSGWNGSSTAVSVAVTHGTTDLITVTGTNLGSVDTKTLYSKKTFACPTSTIVMSGSTVTLTLGGCSTSTSDIHTGVANGAFQWTPTATMTDQAGNSMSTAVTNESGGAQLNF
jgi:chitinase